METNVDLFWSFRSPYSYLAVPGATRLEEDYKVKIRFRSVLPLAVRDPSFFSPDNLKRAKYIRLDWHLGNHLAEAAKRAGLDLASREAAITDPASHRATVEESQHALAKSGHWGVPTFVFEGEPFFGEDRIDTLRWRLDRSALKRA